MALFYFSIFIISFITLAYSSKWLVGSLTKIAKFLGWKEFVVAFFTMALAGAIPNLSVGISSALHKIPQLSFGDIVGGNIVDLTLAVALAVLISKNGLSLPSRVVQGSAIFTLIIAILPLLLVFDGVISQADGLILIITFITYIVWLFSKKERFSKEYNHAKNPLKFKDIFKNLSILFFTIILLFIAAEGIVRSATFFSEFLNFPIALIGILVIGLGNALPEIFFSIQAAKRENDWMVLGNLMGSIIVPATLVLGIVALIHPIEIDNFSPFAIGRFFLIISAIFFFIFLRTDRKITKKEAVFLLLIYFVFVLTEVLFY